jgi:hypothetical protein
VARVAEPQQRRQNERAASPARRCKLSVGTDANADAKIAKFRQTFVLKD